MFSIEVGLFQPALAAQDQVRGEGEGGANPGEIQHIQGALAGLKARG